MRQSHTVGDSELQGSSETDQQHDKRGKRIQAKGVVPLDNYKSSGVLLCASSKTPEITLCILQSGRVS